MIRTLLFTSSVLILGIFLVRKLSLERISMRARYALWILVALRLLFPFSVGESPLSAMNAFPASEPEAGQIRTGAGEYDADQSDLSSGSRGEAAGFEMNEDGVSDGVNAAPQGSAEGAASGVGGQTASGQSVTGQDPVRGQIAGMADKSEQIAAMEDTSGHSVAAKRFVSGQQAEYPDFLRLLFGGIWLSGFLAAGGYMLLSRQRFLRYLKQNRIALSEKAVPEQFTKRLPARGMKVYQVQGLPSPCLVGRDIYVGKGAAADPQSLSHILAHEYSHALHRDGFWAFLRSFLAAVYWFDPLVWAAAYAARQDSELACDEAALKLLGESERFAYGRTLLALLENGGRGDRCPGMAYMLNRGEKGVRERIGALTGYGKKKGAAAVPVFLAALFLSGCAFTGAAKEDAAVSRDTKSVDEQERQLFSGENEAEGFRMLQEHGEKLKEKAAMLEEEAAKMLQEQDEAGQMEEALQDETLQAAFEEALHDRGVMEGRDDSELALKRQADYQAYYRFVNGEGENPMEKGWYLLCEDQAAGISLYGLYTEEFGFRGLKTLIGEDVNAFDGKWCASYLNAVDGNIRVLEQAGDGLPRRFVWKLPAEESGIVEVWRYYSAHRYDTGTVEVKTLMEEDCLAWAGDFTFSVDQEAAEVLVTCDGDMYLGSIDISAYRDWEVEDVQIVPDAVSFVLDDPGADIYQAYSDAVWEKTAAHLAVGLKFEGVEGLWFDGLPLLTIQIAEDRNSASGFRLDYPRIDETCVASVLWQERKLAELRSGISEAQTSGRSGDFADPGSTEDEGKNDLEKPFVNEGEGHYDVSLDFINPCPAYERISNPYGERKHPVTGAFRTHAGVDLAAAEGADILAAADGTVFVTGSDAVNGNYVVLYHEQSGQMTYYAHCKAVEVEKGQQVKQGEKIAAVGQTGQATGPFLHFAISYENNWEEPYFLELD